MQEKIHCTPIGQLEQYPVLALPMLEDDRRLMRSNAADSQNASLINPRRIHTEASAVGTAEFFENSLSREKPCFARFFWHRRIIVFLKPSVCKPDGRLGGFCKSLLLLP